MKYFIYAYRNKAISAYGIPFFDKTEPKDLGVQIQRMITLYPEKSTDLKVCDLYSLGTFDDVSGSFEIIDPEFVLSCGDFFKMEVIKDE